MRKWAGRGAGRRRALSSAINLHPCMLTDAACLWCTQVLAVAVAAVTDLWTRQAFVKADGLQRQQQQQRDAMPVSEATVCQEAAAATSAVNRKAVKGVTTTGRGVFAH